MDAIRPFETAFLTVTTWIPFDTFIKFALATHAVGIPPIHGGTSVGLTVEQTTELRSISPVVPSSVVDATLIDDASKVQFIWSEKWSSIGMVSC